MRKITLLLLVFNFFTLAAQQKGDTEIIINKSVNIEDIKTMLISSKNFIDKINDNVITTELRATTTRPGWQYRYKYTIVILENQVKIYPSWSVNSSLVSESIVNSDWKFSKGKNNINGIIYRETLQMLQNNNYNDIIFN